MTTEEIAPSPLWEALKKTTPTFDEGETIDWSTPAPQRTILDRLTEGILSGQLGLLVLSVAAVFACIPMGKPWVMLSGLLLAPVLSWFLSSLLSRSWEVRLDRFALVALTLFWVIPASLALPIAIFVDRDPLEKVSAVAEWLLSWKSLGFGLLLLCGLLLLTGMVRRRAPWYDPEPAPGWRISLARLIVALPLVAYLGLLGLSQPTEEARSWEAALLRAEPGLEFHRLPDGPQSRNWRRLESSARLLRGWGLDPVPTRAKIEVAQKLEQRALELLTKVPLQNLGYLELHDAEMVLQQLAEHPEFLAEPESTVQALLEVQAERAEPFDFSEALSRLVEFRLKSEDPQQLAVTLEMLRELEESCPGRVEELDRRWYLRSAQLLYPEPFTIGPLGPYSPRLLAAEEARNKRIEGWLRLRPYMRQGLTWDDLQRMFHKGALPSEDAKAVVRMGTHSIHLTQLREYQLQNNTLPGELADFPGSSWQSGRWLWEKEGEHQVLIDTWAQWKVEKDWRWTFQ